MRQDVAFTVNSEREEEAIGSAMSYLGWRVYTTNHLLTERLTLEQAVEAYRASHNGMSRSFLLFSNRF